MAGAGSEPCRLPHASFYVFPVTVLTAFVFAEADGSLLCSAHGVIRTMRRAPCPKAAFARPRRGQLRALLGGSVSMLGTVAVLLDVSYPSCFVLCNSMSTHPRLADCGDNEDCCEIPSTGVVWNADNLQFHRKSFSRLPLGQSALYLFLSLCLPIWGRPVIRLYGLLVDTHRSPACP